jgi:hypothetical protein
MTEPPTGAVDCVFNEFQRLDAKQRALLLRRMWCGEARTPPVTIDDVILKALEGGPVTVNDITDRFIGRVRIRLEKLRVRGIVIREGKGRAHREFIYKLVRPRLARKAIGEAGGGLSQAAKPTPDGSLTAPPPSPAN